MDEYKDEGIVKVTIACLELISSFSSFSPVPVYYHPHLYICDLCLTTVGFPSIHRLD
jgi:hypothetical protein